MELIQNEIKGLKEQILAKNIQLKTILNVEETTSYLNISKSCIYKMTSNREIPFYKPKGKLLYFKRSELDEWVFKARIAPDSELTDEVDGYLSRTDKNLAQ